jgi:type IV pilus assembly PilP-like protein
MVYQYRWWWSSALMLAIFSVNYMQHIRPSLNKLAQFKLETLHLQRHKSISSSMPAIITNKNNIDLLHDFLASIRLIGLQIQSLHVSEQEIIHLILLGNQMQFASLIHALEQNHQQVKNILIKTTETDHLQITMEMLPIKHWQHPAFHFIAPRNAFCHQQTMNQWFYGEQQPDVMAWPLAQIQMVGMLQRGNYREAILLLPDQQVTTITEGLYLGVERAQVSIITSEKISLRLPGRKEAILRMMMSDKS